MSRAEPIATNIERLIAEANDPKVNPTSVAKKAGINPWGVRDILIGKSQHPQHTTLEKIATAFGVPVEQITGEDAPNQLQKRIAEIVSDVPPSERQAFATELASYAEFLKGRFSQSP